MIRAISLAEVFGQRNQYGGRHDCIIATVDQAALYSLQSSAANRFAAGFISQFQRCPPNCTAANPVANRNPYFGRPNASLTAPIASGLNAAAPQEVGELITIWAMKPPWVAWAAHHPIWCSRWRAAPFEYSCSFFRCRRYDLFSRWFSRRAD